MSSGHTASLLHVLPKVQIPWRAPSADSKLIFYAIVDPATPSATASTNCLPHLRPTRRQALRSPRRAQFSIVTASCSDATPHLRAVSRLCWAAPGPTGCRYRDRAEVRVEPGQGLAVHLASKLETGK